MGQGDRARVPGGVSPGGHYLDRGSDQGLRLGVPTQQHGVMLGLTKHFPKCKKGKGA